MTQAASRAAVADHRRSGRSPARPFFAGPVQRKTLPEETQAKLSVSAPGDRWEREADHMAGEVTSGQGPAPGQPAPAARITPVTAAGLREDPAQRQTLARPGGVPEALSATEELSAQRAEEGLTEEEPAQLLEEDPVPAAQDLSTPEAEEEPAQTEPDEEAPAQARSVEPGGPDAAALADRAMARSRGQGDPLPPLVMDRMQSRFGADFQGIRIHTDSAAVQITRALRAQAVTRGSDIYFNAGRFTPDSRTGAELLAHELTHALQQGAAPAADSAAGRADPLQTAAEPQQDESYEVRPEILTAIRLARGEAGKVNAKAYGPDGKRIGWQRLQLYFTTAVTVP